MNDSMGICCLLEFELDAKQWQPGRCQSLMVSRKYEYTHALVRRKADCELRATHRPGLGKVLLGSDRCIVDPTSMVEFGELGIGIGRMAAKYDTWEGGGERNHQFCWKYLDLHILLEVASKSSIMNYVTVTPGLKLKLKMNL